jgi:hypothetical protein
LPGTNHEDLLIATTATLPSSKSLVHLQSKPTRSTLLSAAFVFLLSYILLFIGMDLTPNIFDESIILTGAMRVVAGLIPHQDFYSNYGPGQYYMVAALFKLFGTSVLAERLYDLFLKALIVSLVYTTVSSWCRRSIAAWTTIATLLWLFGLDQAMGTALIPVSLLNLVAAILILPVFAGPLPAKRIFAAGAVAGIAALFRYDTGVALFGIETCILAIAVALRTTSMADRLRNFASVFWPSLLAFVTVTLAALAYYLSRGPLFPFVHDILIYPSKYYYRGRNLPFPAITLKGLDNIGIYLPVGILAVSLYAVLASWLRAGDGDSTSSYDDTADKPWHGFLITFGLLTFVMYLKGYVRVSLVHMYLAILPSLFLIAVLYQYRDSFTRPLRTSIHFLAWLSIFVAGLSAVRQVRVLINSHKSVPEHEWLSSTGRQPEIETSWCKIEGPLTTGLCFLPDHDHIQAIEFIESHTRPGDRLFVGQPRHDIVFANDLLIYFATQRLPATKWSQFDPDLVNRYDIQTQIVRDLDINAPPYIALDSAFDMMHEPNDSSKSSGVTLLDDYIHKQYRPVETFGEIAVWQRNQTR